jgi:hypothetical protein
MKNVSEVEHDTIPVLGRVPAPVWLLEQTTRRFEQTTKFHKERYRRPYRW